MSRFLSRQFTGGVKTLRKQPREERRHVLHNEDGQWKVSRESWKYCAQSGRSSRGDANHHNLRPHVQLRRPWRIAPRRQSRRDVHRFRLRRGLRLSRRAEELLDLGDHLFPQTCDREVERSLVGDLGHIVVGPESKGLERLCGATLGERAAHDDPQVRDIHAECGAASPGRPSPASRYPA